MQHHPTPILDEHWQGFELAADDTHRYLWIWLGCNLRLVAVPIGDITGYDHGWCYPRDPELVAAAVAAWDPDTQDEPDGWHKRATWPVRRAPRRDTNPGGNRPRCAHGCYLDDGCRTLNCEEALARRDAARTTLEGTR
ncbi:hypothetical protein [Streptomyces sp. NBC_00425]|uniref:hypothetical protein n=1 Tax=Streptomyces sp. NBC_00425 TaxID=2975740 RepID=UPI002E225CE4